ncbi:hypothetical protein Btru_061091 [Bulinus truncatus]|nr:hypothetical protein Btru_061091 [Bulinus truncatus]
MDGNRRFAVKKSIAKCEGHLKGFDKLAETLEWCLDLGITEVTVYAFSIENFKRSADEVTYLMELSRQKFAKLLQERDLINKHGVCVRIIGDVSLLPRDLQELLAEAVSISSQNKRAILNVCFAYTARDDMCMAIREAAAAVKDGFIKKSDISEELLEKCLYTCHSSPVDLLIRTSGELRLSDFLLWESSFSCLAFVKVLWPEFSVWHMYAAILHYQRNYNKIQLLLPRSQQSATNEAEGDSEEEEEASLGQERVSAPSFTVIAPPAYLQYASFEERVQSFIISLVTLIYSPTFFARAGFFYAGYQDCVRCFQCGLGLRSWKAGDNVYEQHLKHRPDCQYLKTQLKSGTPTPNDQWLSENVQSNGSQATKVPSDSCGIYATESETIYNVRPMESSPKQCVPLDIGESTQSENLDATKTDEANNHQQQDKKLAMNLLLSENEMLKSNLLCKVCHKEPVRDLFLPCGELYACSDCSKMLTHCPSCKHQIMATVTTYLT